jgi:hypothetical protein
LIVDLVVFRPGALERVGFIVVGLALVGLFATIAVVGSAAWAVFAAVALEPIWEAIRVAVRVDLNRRTISSTRAFRTITVPIDRIESVRVPSWGPVSLALTADADTRRSLVKTGLYARRRSPNDVADKLAAVLNVPVVFERHALRSTREA